MTKDVDNIYYCTKNQVRDLCVDGDMVLLFFGLFHGKLTISPPTQNAYALDFWYSNRYCQHLYHTKNQVGGSYVGGVSLEIFENSGEL